MHLCSIIHHNFIEKVFDYVRQEGGLWQLIMNCNCSWSILLSNIFEEYLCFPVGARHTCVLPLLFSNFTEYFAGDPPQHSHKCLHRASFSLHPSHCKWHEFYTYEWSYKRSHHQSQKRSGAWGMEVWRWENSWQIVIHNVSNEETPCYLKRQIKDICSENIFVWEVCYFHFLVSVSSAGHSQQTQNEILKNVF